LVEVVRMAILEGSVHLLDVHAALGTEPNVPDAALRMTVALLAHVADPIVFIDAATGRSSVNPLPVIR
jgi:hypothetical protein